MPRLLKICACCVANGQDVCTGVSLQQPHSRRSLCVLCFLQALAACHKLETVNFTWCIQLTDEGICPLAKGCTQLQSLSLHGLRGISNRTINALTENCCNSLCTLDVHGCVGIKTNNKSMQAYLQELFPHVTQFVIHT